MSTDVRPFDALAKAELASERRRTLGMLWAIAALAVVTTVRWTVDPASGLTAAASLTLLGAAVAYEAVMLRFIERRLTDGRVIPAGVWYVNIAVEVLIPTVAIVVLAGSGLFRPRQALVAPSGLVFFLLILLSTLRLNRAMSVFTGIASATGYLLATALILWSYPPSAPGLDFTVTVYGTFAALYVIGGVVAGYVATEIRTHVAAAVREVETRAQKEKLERDLGLARSIQQGLLPSKPPRSARFAVAGWNQPADATGGDYYDWQSLPDGRIVVILADVTGHGIGPALMAAASRAYGRATVPGDGLEAAMTRMNDLLSDDLPPGKLVTLVAALIHPETNRVELLSAGHGPLLFYTAADARLQQFEAHGVPFGVVPGLPYGPSQSLDLDPGDLVILLTDGFFEWANDAGEEFGLVRLEEAVRASASLPPDQLIARLHAAVTSFAAGTGQADDLTAVVIKRTS